MPRIEPDGLPILPATALTPDQWTRTLAYHERMPTARNAPAQRHRPALAGALWPARRLIAAVAGACIADSIEALAREIAGWAVVACGIFAGL